MGNEISSFCGCSYNQNKGMEHNIIDYAMNQKRINNNKIFSPEDNNKEDLFMSNMDKNKAKNFNEKSTNLSDNEDGNPCLSKSNLESNQFSSDDFIYEGQYLNGLKYGKGLLKKKLNGEIVYEGFFKDDKFNGIGTLFLNNGYVYEGSFLNGKKQGKGCLYSQDRKFIYEGDWIDDEKEGYGKEIFPDGTRFEGEFEKGKKNGMGKYFFTNGSKYEGGLKNDKLEGFGKFVWNQDRFYEGEWKNNSINGFGIFIDSGKIYLGNFINDKKNGHGIYISKNNSNKFIGYFRENQINGVTIILKDNENFDNGNICITENGKTIACNSESEKANLKLRQEYKELKVFYHTNYEKIKQIIECF